MRRWYLAVESNATIGARFGLHQSKVRRVLIEAGITMRTRRDQVALQDQRDGVRMPTCEELATGYETEGLTIVELAQRHEVSTTRIALMLRRCGIERRPGAARPHRLAAERAARRPPELTSMIISLYGAGQSRSAIARQVDVHRVVVDDVLRRAGVELRSRRKLPPADAWAHRYLAGETAAQIAATYGTSPEAVYRSLHLASVDRRAAGARGTPLPDEDVVALYVDQRLSLRDTANLLGASIPRVREVLAHLGKPRAGFDPATVDRPRFSRRYVDGATFNELASAFGLTPHQVTVTVRAFELPRRPPASRRPLTISDRQLAALVDAGYSDVDIATRHNVAVWAVLRLRRQNRLLRPPPNRVRPPVTRADLKRQLSAGVSRADIATAHHVGLATVTRWCTHYELDVIKPPRSTCARGIELEPQQLRTLYVDEQWTVRQIADHLGVDAALVNFAMHTHRIPVRHGGNGLQDDAIVLLDELYANTQVVAVLEHHHVPVRRRGGSLARRFPRPKPLDPDLVDELYAKLGLSATQISLITGHSASNVLDLLRRNGTPSRTASRSPWYERTLM